jgi:plasmid stabilization system protein ParE
VRVRFTEAAEVDLAAAVAYYDGQGPEISDSFLGEVEAAVARISQFPNAWHKFSQNTRRCRLRRFPYGLLYRVEDDRAVVVAVAHLHSEPTQWLRRLEG